MAIPANIEARFLVASGVFIFIAIALALLGERVLPLLGHDRELAARVYKTLYAFLAGCAVSFAAPAIITAFVARLRVLFERTDARGVIADFIRDESMPHLARIVGLGLMTVFAVATVIAVITIWLRGQ